MYIHWGSKRHESSQETILLCHGGYSCCVRVAHGFAETYPKTRALLTLYCADYSCRYGWSIPMGEATTIIYGLQVSDKVFCQFTVSNKLHSEQLDIELVQEINNTGLNNAPISSFRTNNRNTFIECWLIIILCL